MKKYRRIISFIVLVVCVSLLTVSFAAVATPQEEVSAIFVNVGKADAALFFLGEKRYLVDTGSKDSFDALEQALEIYEVTKLDGVIITHTDKDHIGGLKKLLKSDVTVEMLYAGTIHGEPDPDKHPVYKASQKYNVPLTWLAAGDLVQVTDDIVFSVLGPLSVELENENNNSLILDLQTLQGNMLLTGDMELEEESELLAGGLIPKATVLKVAHHGEDDSSSETFIYTVKPQWAVISTNTAEEADTPDEKVVARLWSVPAGVAVTQDAQIGIYVSLHDGIAVVSNIDLK